jgi:phosphoribosylformylglycinamidine cyclo-ligase
MRHGKELTYRFHTLPPVPEVLQFLQQQTGSDDRAAYGNLNMGAGFALFVAASDADRVVQIAAQQGIKAWNAGVVEKGDKQVVIEPLGLTFTGDDLHVRA